MKSDASAIISTLNYGMKSCNEKENNQTKKPLELYHLTKSGQWSDCICAVLYTAHDSVSQPKIHAAYWAHTTWLTNK